MPKGKKGKQSGRVDRPSRPSHLRVVARPGQEHHDQRQDAPAELLSALRQGLRNAEPLDLLLVVSSIICATDHGPLRSPGDDTPVVPLADLVESFIGVDYAETTAALSIMRVLLGSHELTSGIQRELARRRQPMPQWVQDFDQARVLPRVASLIDVLGDGCNYLIGLELKDGRQLTAVVYVDVNLGRVVKDAFIIPESLDATADHFRSIGPWDGQSIVDVDPADARAAIEHAIDLGNHMYPPLESDSWPLCQPLVEWMVRQYPGGGEAPDQREWTEGELKAITEDFLASDDAQHLRDPDHADLMDSLLWFASGWSGGDPFRWSPVRVEMLLADWFPRKVMADAEYLSKLPTVLRSYIRYCHQRADIPASRTRETLLAVDEWEPEYQGTIRSERLQGAQALIASMLPHMAERLWDVDSLDDFDRLDGVFDAESWTDEDFGSYMLSRLDLDVGDRTALMNLDTDPLPDEAFSWTDIPDDIRQSVEVVLMECDRVATERLSVELRTSMRRLLRRIALGDPGIFRRRASLQRGAAAVAWLAYRANDDGSLQTQDLLAAFDVTGSVSQRAEPMLRAIGINPHTRYGAHYLGAADLLTSSRRAQLIAARDRYLAMRTE